MFPDLAVPVGPLQVEVHFGGLRGDGQEDPHGLREQVVRLDGHRGHRQAEGQGGDRGKHRQVVR